MSWAPTTTPPTLMGVVGNGLGNGFWMYDQIQPAMLRKMTRSPMQTITIERIGLFSTGRMITRSTSTPPTNDSARVAKKATQYGIPALIIVHARYVLNIA